MKLLLVNQAPRDRVPGKWLGRWLRALSLELKRRRLASLGRAELVCVFVNSAEMRRLNAQFRGKNYATDVLSFQTGDPSCVGELVLCLPVLRAQAKRMGLSERGELGYMVVHGVLHLLGFDHESREGEIEMFALQDSVFAAVESKVGYR
ncbi:MAG TPA: rRNA maturation RNase YbeY [Bdellovibrionales bacterium]|nr:rRNA maturation RNase YbeY [Bdellovibrionales bacterium]